MRFFQDDKLRGGATWRSAIGLNINFLKSIFCFLLVFLKKSFKRYWSNFALMQRHPFGFFLFQKKPKDIACSGTGGV